MDIGRTASPRIKLMVEGRKSNRKPPNHSPFQALMNETSLMGRGRTKWAKEKLKHVQKHHPKSVTITALARIASSVHTHSKSVSNTSENLSAPETRSSASTVKMIPGERWRKRT